jgi:iron complex transport system permease protein
LKKSTEDVHFDRVSHWKTYITILIAVFIVTIVFSLNLGFSQIPVLNVLEILIKNTPFLGSLTHFTNIPSIQEVIITQIRLPRIVAGALVGAGLSAAGVTYQGIFRNPMADPYIIGASSGAALGAAVAIVFGLGLAMLGVNTVPVFAFIGCVSTVLIVRSISRVGSRVPVSTLLLSGIALNSFMLAIVAYLQTIAGNRLGPLTFWLLGGLSAITWNSVWSAFPFILVGIVVTYLYYRDLNLLTLGEDQAQHLGVNLERTKLILLISSAFLTAAAVSISGLIGFVGLIIPHLTRLFTGPDHRILIPASVILGASFMVICDALSRVLTSPTEVPVGIITALFGGPFFISLLRRKRKIDAF